MRDIASAADELSASVNEIDRQVAQSNTIATKAVNEVESTNIAVKELDEAADVADGVLEVLEQRIGHAVECAGHARIRPCGQPAKILDAEEDETGLVALGDRDRPAQGGRA